MYWGPSATVCYSVVIISSCLYVVFYVSSGRGLFVIRHSRLLSGFLTVAFSSRCILFFKDLVYFMSIMRVLMGGRQYPVLDFDAIPGLGDTSVLVPLPCAAYQVSHG